MSQCIGIVVRKIEYPQICTENQRYLTTEISKLEYFVKNILKYILKTFVCLKKLLEMRLVPLNSVGKIKLIYRKKLFCVNDDFNFCPSFLLLYIT